MNIIHRSIKPFTLAILGALCMPAAQAELVNEAWVVRSGDGLYGIARKLAPKDLKMQARIRTEISQLNPGVNTNNLDIGLSLKLPTFLFEKAEPAPVVTPAALPEPPAPAQISRAVITPDPQEVIGRVVIQTGNMVAENRGSTRTLNRAANIMKGDTLKTAGNARSQIRLKDGALIAISPYTELKFEEFAYNGSEDGTERSILNLIKGGFRTITGAIGHVNKQNYQVKTSVATIGIRGTHYGLMLCESGSCANNPENGNLSDGLYGGVVDGSIVTDNDTGSTTFNNDQYFHIETAQTAPVETLLPPPVFNDAPTPGDKPDEHDMAGPPPEGQMPGDPNEGPGNQLGGPGPNDGGFNFNHNPMVMNLLSGDFLPPKDFQPGQNNPPPLPGDQNLPQQAPNGAGLAISLSQFDANGAVKGVGVPIIINASNNNMILLEEFTDSSGHVIKNLPFSIHEEHTEQLFDINQNPIGTELQTHNANRLRLNGPGAGYDETQFGGNNIGVNWGVWQGNYVITESVNGSASTELPHDVYAHFIYSDHLTSPTELANLGGLTGMIQAYHFFDGTTPTSSDSTLQMYMTKPNITATVDFSSHELVSYNFLMSSEFSYQAWLASPVNFSDLGKSFQLVSGNSPTDPNPLLGQASLTFIGSNAGGAMTSYSLWYTDGSSGINGVALLTPGGNSGTPNTATGLFAIADSTAGHTEAFAVGGDESGNMFVNTSIAAPVAMVHPFTDTNAATHYQSMAIIPSQATAPSTGFQILTFADTSTGIVNWGYWDSATMTKDTGSITDRTHFIYSDNITTAAQLGGLTGTMQYGTSTVNATDEIGTVITSGSIIMNVDYDLHQMTSYDVAVGALAATSSSPVDFSNMGKGFQLVAPGACSVNCAAGYASVKFVGPAADNAITSFAIQSTTNAASHITGTGVLVNNW